MVFVANGDFKRHFQDIVKFHHLENRVAVCDFDEQLARQAYAASDFVVMPSRFEPCGLPQMIGSLYGALPIVHDTGGLHDTVTPMDVRENTGNGFLFNNYDASGLLNAIKEAMHFYDLSHKERNRQVERVMAQSLAAFNPAITASQYIELYEKMLERPLVTL
jgi:starch synthase/alpha-amylase